MWLVRALSWTNSSLPFLSDTASFSATNKLPLKRSSLAQHGLRGSGDTLAMTLETPRGQSSMGGRRRSEEVGGGPAERVVLPLEHGLQVDHGGRMVGLQEKRSGTKTKQMRRDGTQWFMTLRPQHPRR